MKHLILFFFSSLWCLSGYSQQSANNEPALIPYPQKIEMKDGKFELSTRTQLNIRDQGLFWNEVAYLQSLIAPALGRALSSEQGSNSIEIVYSDKISNVEAYELDITSDKVTLIASTSTGAFYGIQTIRQLLPHTIESGKRISEPIFLPALRISDHPAFGWRGTMIDVSRHFFSIDYLKRHIDRMSLYKLNKFHLHLTDDQGWRIEIKKYPELTGEGAWRTFNDHDTICMKLAKENPDFEIDSRYILKKDGKEIYGGYYTHDQIRELIKYAAARHIEIIPEIDMPGHMMAATLVYPQLTDMKDANWGKDFSIPLCPCKEEVYTFVEDVLSEIIDLFPSPYIHIGADEVEKISWQESNLCKEWMQRENIKNMNELQSYFIHRVQDFVELKGKKIIAWDEALEGGVNSNAHIMYWRGWVSDSPMKAAANGNRVIMAPTNPLYFDYLPDKSSLSGVYNMNVIYDNVPKDKVDLIQGAQANLWAEKIPSEKRSEFLMFPRMTALAERVWTNQNLFGSYSNRVLAHFKRLDELKVNYRLPDLTGFAHESVFVKEAIFRVENPLPEMKIHYTTDGSSPNQHSTMLTDGLKITKPVQIKFALFSSGGAKGDIYTVNYRQTLLAKAAKPSKNLNPGLLCTFYNGFFKGTKEIKETPDQSQPVANIVVPKSFITPAFALKYTGYIRVPETGIYSFYFTCDDGGVLYINKEVVVDNDGLHSAIERSGQAALSKGLHPFQLDFVEGGGGFTLKLQYSFNGSEVKDIPDSWFVH